jgi:hypothetical protein
MYVWPFVVSALIRLLYIMCIDLLLLLEISDEKNIKKDFFIIILEIFNKIKTLLIYNEIPLFRG